MNSSTKISATVAGLRLVINMAHLIDTSGRPDDTACSSSTAIPPGQIVVEVRCVSHAESMALGRSSF
jgi:hypothetical protein